VPEVLLSGDHAAIARWRHQQRLERTAARRPDLLAPTAADDPAGLAVVPATPADLPELYVLQLACWVRQAQLNPDVEIPALHETLDDLRASLADHPTWVVRSAGRLVASVRGHLDGTDWEVGRLMVAPDLRGRGLGRRLLAHAEAVAPPSATRFTLFTGARSEENLRMYRRAGYRPTPEPCPFPGAVKLGKPVHR
ncbi:GNAT family N-acetyltransferase, partial [Desertihabitans aurantiacus]|uniref:GNAT family N-acetyltransferase n=1 Tax=Desertihabitans aurantiacus TaxID=2282477 RepID=UPI000DF8455F